MNLSWSQFTFRGDENVTVEAMVSMRLTVLRMSTSAPVHQCRLGDKGPSIGGLTLGFKQMVRAADLQSEDAWWNLARVRQ